MSITEICYEHSIWSEWHDLNVRPLGPECRNTCKIKAFSCFLVLLCRNKNLFRTLRHTVSAQSEAVDGQRCGQINIYHPSDSLKSFKTLRLLQTLYHKSSKISRDMAQNLHRCNQRLSLLTIQIPALKMDKKFDFSTLYIPISGWWQLNALVRFKNTISVKLTNPTHCCYQNVGFLLCSFCIYMK